MGTYQIAQLLGCAVGEVGRRRTCRTHRTCCGRARSRAEIVYWFLMRTKRQILEQLYHQ